MPSRLPRPVLATLDFARTLLQDLRYTLRQLRQAPVYALTAILTLALGLGAATAMLAIVDSVLVRPVALPYAERLVTLSTTEDGRKATTFYPEDVQALAVKVKSFASLAAYRGFLAPVMTSAGTRIAVDHTVLPGFFDIPAVAARQGRLPSASDHSTSWVVVSDAFWRDNLQGDPHTVGSRITVEGRPLTVAGILPPGFKFPDTIAGPVVFTPLLLDGQGKDANGFNGDSEVVARLKPGVTPEAALAEAKAVYAHLPPRKDHKREPLTFTPYRDTVVGDIRPALFALLGACAVLLAIACANSANLQIARAVQRMPEINVRAALGATRRRIFQQLVTESVFVSILGAGLGFLFAAAMLAGIRATYGPQFARFDELAIHPAAFAACTLLAVLTGVFAALAPAWTAMRAATGNPLSQTTRVTRRSRLSGALVAAEVALTCTLLVAAGLFLRTFLALERAPLGFDPRHVMELALMPVNPREDTAALKQTHARILERLRTLSGVASAAAELSLPFSNFNLTAEASLKFPGRPTNKGDQGIVSLLSPDYIRTLGVPLISGRGFLPSDNAGSQTVGLVNEAFARRFFQGQRAIGASVEFAIDSTNGTDNRFLKTPIAVVGVLPDQPFSTLADQAEPTLFLPYAQFPATAHLAHFAFGISPQFAVRSSLPQAVLEREIRAALKEAAPDMAEMQIGSMEANIAASLTRQRLALRLAGGFGLLALALAGVGIYGVLASSVAQRTREIGIRMALGSSRGAAMRLVLRQAGAMVALGLAAGLLCAWPAGRAVKAFLFGVAPLDPLTLVLASLVLLLVCALAAAIPAWRATRVDPVVALRAE